MQPYLPIAIRHKIYRKSAEEEASSFCLELSLTHFLHFISFLLLLFLISFVTFAQEKKKVQKNVHMRETVCLLAFFCLCAAVKNECRKKLWKSISLVICLRLFDFLYFHTRLYFNLERHIPKLYSLGLYCTYCIAAKLQRA